MGTTNGQSARPEVVRRLDTPTALRLAELAERFEDLQTVLRGCERLVSELAAGDEPDGVLVEAVWTMVLLSYARCFTAGEHGTVLTEQDVTSAQPVDGVLDWHRVLMRLRDHHAHPTVNPRERFSVGAAQDSSGEASGIAITSARQPQVDDLTVRRTGAIAYALSALVDKRIEAQQEQVRGELGQMSKADLDRLVRLDLAG